MKKLIFLFLVLSGIFISCKQSNQGTSKTDGDAKFQQLSEEFLSGYLAWRPGLSVYYGFHEYDGKVSDFSKQSLEKELARLKKYYQTLSEFDTTLLSSRMFYDFRLLNLGIKNEIFSFEELEPFTKNPMTYAGAMDLSNYINRNYAPMEDRLKSIIAIEKEAPAFFATAKSNLVDSLAKPYIETAIQIANGSADFLSKDLISALKEVKNDSLMNVFKSSNEYAIKELKSFAVYLLKEKLPRANNKFGLGSEKYQKMLLYGEDISVSPDSILKIGLAEVEKENNIFIAMAKIINPDKTPEEVYKDLKKEHFSAENLISGVKKNVEAIHQYVLDRKIVTIPSVVNLSVEETPEFGRSTSTASMNSPGPFESKATEAFYYVTPVDPGWTVKQKEDWLSMFDIYTTDITTIHEVYPGHYIQFLHLKASSASKIEKIFASYAFIEGWAHYTEKMMLEEGYGNKGGSIVAAKYRMAQCGEALLRLCRLCVSIKMHCHGMTEDEATEFFMQNWHQGEKPSRQEAIRGTFDPGYLFYSLGKLEFLKLREDYKKQEGDSFNLLKFHDLLLDNGAPPIKFLREILLKDKRIWGDIL
jgi:uncharacterized protein (DUF885 family)